MRQHMAHEVQSNISTSNRQGLRYSPTPAVIFLIDEAAVRTEAAVTLLHLFGTAFWPHVDAFQRCYRSILNSHISTHCIRQAFIN